MIYLTGDTHRDFDRVFDFCADNDTTPDDVLIILGDAGINFFLDERDYKLKKQLSTLEVTLLCIHGNHEERPFMIDSYIEKEWHGGVVFYEEEFPNLLFAKDGEIYDLEGRSAIAIGGAYSVDKFYRLQNHLPWFPTEQPTDEIMDDVERALDKVNWRVDAVLSHTTPLKYEPTEEFLDSIDQSTVDSSTEEWLDVIENRLSYERWYCGHFHCDKKDGRITILYEDFEELF
ncbi:MAG: serine/threonine protein phosphatase [Ruminococcaceae bacterium]|nr:serine/threonine protein phosphatase [Oscillospiraceae bacterium]